MPAPRSPQRQTLRGMLPVLDAAAAKFWATTATTASGKRGPKFVLRPFLLGGLGLAVVRLLDFSMSVDPLFLEASRRHYQPSHANVAAASSRRARQRHQEELPATALRPVSDALDAAPETGLDPLGPQEHGAEQVLEHLAYHFGPQSPPRRPDAAAAEAAAGGWRASLSSLLRLGRRKDRWVPLVYFITPTYYRSTQMADMTRLSQTLAHDRRVYWVVVEDRADPRQRYNCTVRMRALLERTGLPFAHLAVPTDPEVKAKMRVKGTAQRNAALEVVRRVGLPGIVYFGDDDNSYDVRLFDQIRQTKGVGVTGVAMSTGPYERCLVNATTGKLDGFLTMWPGNRTYQMDMAGFAFHTDLLRDKHPLFRDDWPRGFLETNFIKQLIDGPDQLEPLDNCTRLYSWHVRTTAWGPNVNSPQRVGPDPDYHKVVPNV